MTVYHIFPEPIYVAENVISKAQNDFLIDECLKMQRADPDRKNDWRCDIYTSFGENSLIHNSAFDDLHNAIAQHVGNFISEHGSQATLSCSEAWFNVAGPKQYQEQHFHPNSIFSAVYYLKAPKGSAETVLKKVYEPMMPFAPNGDNPLAMASCPVAPVERSILIFRSYMPHLVPAGTNTQKRITHASNWK